LSVVKILAWFLAGLLLLTMSGVQAATQPCDGRTIWSIIKDTVDEKILHRFISECDASEYTQLAQQRVELINQMLRSPTAGFPTPKVVRTEKIKP
jgi:hypothetical protein